jgi:hypothetical protein
MHNATDSTSIEIFSNSLCRDIGHDWRMTTAPNYRTCTRNKCRAAQRFHQGRWVDATTRPSQNRTGTVSSHTEQATIIWATSGSSQQDVHITCALEQLYALVDTFEEQFTARQEKVTLLDWGCSYKREKGCLVLEWAEEVDEDFIAHLAADEDVDDFTVYTIPCLTDEQVSLLE